MTNMRSVPLQICKFMQRQKSIWRSCFALKVWHFHTVRFDYVIHISIWLIHCPIHMLREPFPIMVEHQHYKKHLSINKRGRCWFFPHFLPLPNTVSVSVLGFMATEIELIIFSFFSALQSLIFDYSLEISS